MSRSGPGKSPMFDINKVITEAATILWHNINKYTDNFRQELADGHPPGAR